MADTMNSVRDTVVEYLNSATFTSTDKEKIEILSKVQELVIHRDQTLLDAFFEDIVVFQNDRNGDVRKFVVGFIEEACKNDHAMLPRLVPNICMLLQDNTIAVVKRVIQASSQIYKSTLLWLSSAGSTTKEMEQTWEVVSSVKTKILKMIDHDNDGVRTQAIKFLESVILMQTYLEKDSMQRTGDMSLEQVPLTLKVIRPRKLEEDAKHILDKIIEFQGSLHISSVNLMTCMSSLSIIARARPQFMGRIVEALEILHANLPPTLTTSQVNSVRKHLKVQMLNILKHSGAYDYQSNVIAILNDLNASSSEINKAMPSKDELKKRVKRQKSADDKTVADAPSKKRPRTDKTESGSVDPEPSEPSTAVDITHRWLLDQMNIESVTNLVMVSMLNLPDALPSVFSATYKPVSSAGTQSQVEHLARLLASQLTAAGIGPGAEVSEKRKEEEKFKEALEELDEPRSTNRMQIPSLGAPKVKAIDSIQKTYDKPLMPAAAISRPMIQRVKFVKLSEVTKALMPKETLNLHLILLKVVLKSNTMSLDGVSCRNRLRMIAKMASLATYEELVELESFIFEDLIGNLDLLLSWLYSLYSMTHNFDHCSRVVGSLQKSSSLNEFQTYDSFFVHILKKILDVKPNMERNELIAKLIMDSPSITNEAFEVLLSGLDQGTGYVQTLATLLNEIISLRPILAVQAVNALSSACTHNSIEVRDVVGPIMIELCSNDKLKEVIIEAAQTHLGYLVETKPPAELFKSYFGREECHEEWTDDAVKACLYLTLIVLPLVQDLIHFLAQVYVKTVNEAKRTILRYLETPVSYMGMESPTLLSLVETCPKGSETLVTRVIHILTEKAPPSEELVSRVKELYNKRVSDVRFLIPVLTGLSKKEIIAVLPKLIKLNPQVVKEVFNRLWGVTLDIGTSPLSAADLLVALHLINPEKCDMKAIIKATGLCFAERNIYNAEVLAVVIQQLMEEPTLPTLFMRTVIQTLTHHPKLLSFIMNVLQRLISKKIWKQGKAWEGFIKCCQRSMPQSFIVLLQLPHVQLAEAMIEAPDIQIKLLAHVNELTDAQRTHIPSSLMEVIEYPDRKLEAEKANRSPKSDS